MTGEAEGQPEGAAVTADAAPAEGDAAALSPETRVSTPAPATIAGPASAGRPRSRRKAGRSSGRARIAGDVADGVDEVAGWLSPNPGGVGPMTRVTPGMSLLVALMFFATKMLGLLAVLVMADRTTADDGAFDSAMQGVIDRLDPQASPTVH